MRGLNAGVRQRMTWFAIGAFLALGVLVANSAFVIARRRRVPEATPRPSLRKQMPTSDVVALLLMVAAWGVGLGAPVLWPGTAFGNFMNSTLNLMAYFIWCGIAYVAFRVVWYFTTSRSRRRNDGAV